MDSSSEESDEEEVEEVPSIMSVWKGWKKAGCGKMLASVSIWASAQKTKENATINWDTPIKYSIRAPQ